jgi:hypothetical protein
MRQYQCAGHAHGRYLLLPDSKEPGSLELSASVEGVPLGLRFFAALRSPLAFAFLRFSSSSASTLRSNSVARPSAFA